MCVLFNLIFVLSLCVSRLSQQPLVITITVWSTLSFMYIKLLSALHNVCCAVILIFNRIHSQFFKIKMGKIKKYYSEFSCIVSWAKRKHPLMEGRNPGDGYLVFRERPQNCHFLALCVYKVVEAGPGGSVGGSVTCMCHSGVFCLFMV
jgi:hypothetical protein